ncbi:hypothetical protein FDJ58_gp070 [Bacillus phage SIOphi]|uniref:Uncharacterized protein n=1 Tax=Bacillus phage SIOphi TaxID=1285382 RepID=R4JEY8_9CAUD|nr:hypothetical protein FDJ58_gp070 [Bacillus phage SIOphi]AGK86878.1 hypothetical protein SIOphi_00350 [Bacillus phage SIOphi]
MTDEELRCRLRDLYADYENHLDTPIIVESPEGKLKIKDVTVNFGRFAYNKKVIEVNGERYCKACYRDVIEDGKNK